MTTGKSCHLLAESIPGLLERLQSRALDVSNKHTCVLLKSFRVSQMKLTHRRLSGPSGMSEVTEEEDNDTRRHFNMNQPEGGAYPPGVTKRPHVYFQGRYIREPIVMAPLFYSGRMFKCLMTTSPVISVSFLAGYLLHGAWDPYSKQWGRAASSDGV
jgi:hypothetical protein